MRGTMLRAGEQNNPATVPSYNSMHWRPANFIDEENGISWRIVHSLLTHCSKMLVFGAHLVDQTFCGPWTNLHEQSPYGPELVTDAGLVWSLTFITRVNSNNIVMWEHCTTMQIGTVFRTLILLEIVEDSESTSGGLLCIFGSHTFVPRSWMCKKQTSVSHSSTEAEITFLDAGLRMDGNPALDLWDLVIEVFHSSPNQLKKSKGHVRGNSYHIKQAHPNQN